MNESTVNLDILNRLSFGNRFSKKDKPLLIASNSLMPIYSGI